MQAPLIEIGFLEFPKCGVSGNVASAPIYSYRGMGTEIKLQ